MILDGKYIVSDKNNLMFNIRILIGLGYDTSLINEIILDYDYPGVDKFIIITIGEKIRLHNYEHYYETAIIYKDEINIIRLLREEKLKRILKCC